MSKVDLIFLAGWAIVAVLALILSPDVRLIVFESILHPLGGDRERSLTSPAEAAPVKVDNRASTESRVNG